MNSEFDMKRFLSLLAQTSSGHNASRNSVVIASMVTELYARKADAEERLCDSVASLCDICNKTVHDDFARDCNLCRFGKYRKIDDRKAIRDERDESGIGESLETNSYVLYSIMRRMLADADTVGLDDTAIVRYLNEIRHTVKMIEKNAVMEISKNAVEGKGNEGKSEN